MWRRLKAYCFSRARRLRDNAHPRRFRAHVELETAANALKDQGALAIYNHFDAHGSVAGYVLHHVKALYELGHSIVFVTTSPAVQREDLQSLSKYCWLVLRRTNVGFDIGGWPCALQMVEARRGSPFGGASRVVIANDSVFGPVVPLSPIFNDMAQRRLDCWGITESVERTSHLQTYFLVFEHRGVRFLHNWLLNFRVMSIREDVVAHHEVGLTREARSAGLRVDAMLPLATVRAFAASHSATTGLHAVPNGERIWHRTNPTHAFWQETLDLGSPFIKRDLLRNLTQSVGQEALWRETLRRRAPDYPVMLIDSYLAE